VSGILLQVQAAEIAARPALAPPFTVIQPLVFPEGIEQAVAAVAVQGNVQFMIGFREVIRKHPERVPAEPGKHFGCFGVYRFRRQVAVVVQNLAPEAPEPERAGQEPLQGTELHGLKGARKLRRGAGIPQ
jgi:hypothetical protein